MSLWRHCNMHTIALLPLVPLSFIAIAFMEHCIYGTGTCRYGKWRDDIDWKSTIPRSAFFSCDPSSPLNVFGPVVQCTTIFIQFLYVLSNCIRIGSCERYVVCPMPNLYHLISHLWIHLTPSLRRPYIHAIFFWPPVGQRVNTHSVFWEFCRKPCQHATRGCDKRWMTCIHAGVSRSPREHASVPRTKGTAVSEWVHSFVDFCLIPLSTTCSVEVPGTNL